MNTRVRSALAVGAAVLAVLGVTAGCSGGKKKVAQVVGPTTASTAPTSSRSATKPGPTPAPKPAPAPASAKGKRVAPDPAVAVDSADPNPIVPPPAADSAHIAGPGTIADARKFGLSDGVVKTEKAPDGTTRRVRTVGPSL